MIAFLTSVAIVVGLTIVIRANYFFPRSKYFSDKPFDVSGIQYRLRGSSESKVLSYEIGDRKVRVEEGNFTGLISASINDEKCTRAQKKAIVKSLAPIRAYILNAIQEKKNEKKAELAESVRAICMAEIREAKSKDELAVYLASNIEVERILAEEKYKELENNS